MNYQAIIDSSVKAEFEAVCAKRKYCRLPKGHPVYMHPMIQHAESEAVNRIAFKSAGAKRKR
jgi:hypothetical protein